MTDDPRYVVVDGRRCRATDPGIPSGPSDAARVVAGDRFRSAMDDARRVAGELREAGVVRTPQRGAGVDPLAVHGPLRIGRGPHWER